PSAIQVGVLIFAKSAFVQCGWLFHTWVIWSTKLLYSVGVGESFAYSSRARDIGVDDLAVRRIRHARWIVVGCKRKQFRQAFGVMHRDVEADDRTVAPADQSHFPDFQKIEQADHVARHQIIAEGFRIARRAAMAAA